MSQETTGQASGWTSGPATTGHAVLDAVCAAWNRAARGWDADALAELYADDALFFGGRPGHAVGREAIRQYFRSYVGVIERAALALFEQEVRELSPGVLLAQGYGRFEFVLAGAQETRSVLRTTLVLVRAGGDWRIRQHHFSTSPEAPPLGQR